MDRSLPRGNDSWTVIWFHSSEVISQPRSQLIDNLRPLIDLRSRVTSSGRTPDGLFTLNRNPLQSATYCMFPLKEMDSVSLNIVSTNSYWCSAVLVEVTVNSLLQLWVKGQVQKHVCGSETEQLSVTFKALGNPRKSGNYFELQTDEVITFCAKQNIQTCLSSFSMLILATLRNSKPTVSFCLKEM